MVTGGTDEHLLVVTRNGYGKRSPLADYRVTGRGGKGVITVKTTQRNGPVVALKKVVNEDELMIMTKSGVIIRLPIKGVSLQGRNTQGVRLINLDPGDEVMDVARVANEDEGTGGDAGTAGNGGNGGRGESGPGDEDAGTGTATTVQGEGSRIRDEDSGDGGEFEEDEDEEDDGAQGNGGGADELDDES
jgi:DNA gyrase subunit A